MQTQIQIQQPNTHADDFGSQTVHLGPRIWDLGPRIHFQIQIQMQIQIQIQIQFQIQIQIQIQI